MELSIKLGSSGAAVRATGRVSRAKGVRHLSMLDAQAATMAPKVDGRHRSPSRRANRRACYFTSLGAHGAN